MVCFAAEHGFYTENISIYGFTLIPILKCLIVHLKHFLYILTLFSGSLSVFLIIGIIKELLFVFSPPIEAATLIYFKASTSTGILSPISKIRHFYCLINAYADTVEQQMNGFYSLGHGEKSRSYPAARRAICYKGYAGYM